MSTTDATPIKHDGCYLCGSVDDPILISIPLFMVMHSIAVCPPCHRLSPPEIKARFQRMEAEKKEAAERKRMEAHRG